MADELGGDDLILLLLVGAAAWLLFSGTSSSGGDVDQLATSDPLGGVPADSAGGSFFSSVFDFGGGSIFQPREPDYSYAQGSAFGTSAAGQAKIKSNEGLALYSYADGPGRSIGYGHQIQPGETLPEPISQGTADALFSSDLARVEAAINGAVQVPLTQGEFDALADFVFNVGTGAFQGSTLLVKLNGGDYAGARDELGRWIHASGAVNSALVARRADEASMFA